MEFDLYWIIWNVQSGILQELGFFLCILQDWDISLHFAGLGIGNILCNLQAIFKQNFGKGNLSKLQELEYSSQVASNIQSNSGKGNLSKLRKMGYIIVLTNCSEYL